MNKLCFAISIEFSISKLILFPFVIYSQPANLKKMTTTANLQRDTVAISYSSKKM
jgi:hypothetical protein